MKAWIFRLLLIVLPPLVLLLGAEGLLRAIGFGDSLSFAHRTEVRGEEHWVDNPRFGRLFFPPQLARACLPFVIQNEKPASTFRVFVLGGSAAMGIPEPAYGLSRMLEEMLREAAPEAEIEVINTAITAINSHVVLRIARACAEMSPDLFVIYLGNNEVVGPYGAGTIFGSLSSNVGLIRAGLDFRTTRLGQWTTGLLRDDSQLPTSWQGMEMFEQNRVPADDPRMRVVYDNFERNLQDILAIAESHGVPTLVGTVAVNLRDSAPFASVQADLDASTRRHWVEFQENARAAARSSDFGAAVGFLDRALALDAGHAETHYRRGRWLEAGGDFPDARVSYARARDLDALRFRYDSTLDVRLRRVVDAAPTSRLVDVSAAIDRATPHGIPGREMFLEHVHFTPEGNYVASREFFEAAREILEERLGSTVDAAPLAFEELRRRIALTPWDEHRVRSEIVGMLQRPPFVAQSTQAEQIAYWQAEADALSSAFDPQVVRGFAAQYRDAIRINPDSWILKFRLGGFLLNALADAPSAERVFRELTRTLPHFPAARNELASALAAQGRMELAADELRVSLDLNPFQASARSNLGNCLLAAGDPASRTEAIQQYARAYELDPTDQFRRNWNLARHREARWLAGQSRPQDAVRLFREILATDAEDPEAHFNLAVLLADEDRAAALGHAREAVRLAPDNDQGKALLQKLTGP